jgi:hypothetical protein
MVLNATFNNISVISWWSVLLAEETIDRSWCKSDRQTLSHNVVSNTPRLNSIRLRSSEVIGTDCIGSCKSNYQGIIGIEHNLE